MATTSLNSSRHLLRRLLALAVLALSLGSLQGLHACYGAFSHSCDGERYTGTSLTAACNNGNGGYDTSSLNLDDILSTTMAIFNAIREAGASLTRVRTWG